MSSYYLQTSPQQEVERYLRSGEHDVLSRNWPGDNFLARAQHGDTFAVHSGNDRYLFTFSPTGVESFYGLPEEKASKGVADYLMLRRKLPDEIFDGRRLLPSTLFRRDDVAGYLVNLDRALDETIVELGVSGSVDAQPVLLGRSRAGQPPSAATGRHHRGPDGAGGRRLRVADP